jgi:hypothetical protein
VTSYPLSKNQNAGHLEPKTKIFHLKTLVLKLKIIRKNPRKLNKSLFNPITPFN